MGTGDVTKTRRGMADQLIEGSSKINGKTRSQNLNL